eukprot:474640_1
MTAMPDEQKSVSSGRTGCFPSDDRTNANTEYCREYSRHQHIVRCDSDPKCKWEPASDVQAALKIKTKHLTLVNVEGGRLRKDLAPIEAVTELIGDYVMYRELTMRMNSEYVSALGMKRMNNLQLRRSARESYVVLPIMIPEFARALGTKVKGLELTEKPIQTVIQTLLEYSRPYFDAQPYDQSKVTIESFTMSNVYSLAVSAFVDMYAMNIDRYHVPHLGGKRPNEGNMMLYEKSQSPKRWVYIPIDQGFARQLTNPWFKWLGVEDSATQSRWGQDNLSGLSGAALHRYKQLIHSNTWFNQGKLLGRPEKRTELATAWENLYREWLHDPNKAMHFVEDNLVYFPKEIATNEEMKTQVIGFVDQIWKVTGPNMCIEITKFSRAIIKKIHKNKEGVDVKTLLKGTGWTPGGLRETIGQWSMVKTAMNKQSKICTDWAQEAATLDGEGGGLSLWLYMRDRITSGDPLFEDYRQRPSHAQATPERISLEMATRRETRAQSLSAMGEAPLGNLFPPQQGVLTQSASGIGNAEGREATINDNNANGIRHVDPSAGPPLLSGSASPHDQAFEVQYGDVFDWNYGYNQDSQMQQSPLYDYNYDANQRYSDAWTLMIIAAILFACSGILWICCCIANGALFILNSIGNRSAVWYPWLSGKQCRMHVDEQDESFV